MQEEHTCCWHRNSRAVIATNPPQFEEVCCHCGKIAWRTPPKPEPPPGHGPYYPQPAPYTMGGAWKTFSSHSCGCRPENGGNGVCNCILGSHVTC